MLPNTGIRSLDQRLDCVEAELAIRNVIALYGIAADCGDIDTALACHAEEAVYMVSNPNTGRGEATDDLEISGHRAIREMLSSAMHQSLLPNCAHTVGPLVVKLSEPLSSATVLGYSRVYHQKDGDLKLMRLAFNRWDMRKISNSWKIARRESRVMGEDAAQDMLKRSLGHEV